jgi:cellulose binding protein with CBM2 domain
VPRVREKAFTLFGIAALIAFGAITAIRLVPGDDTVSLPPPEPAFTLPGFTSGPQIPVSLLPRTPTSGPAVSRSVEKNSETSPAGDAAGDPEPTRGGTTPPRTTVPPGVAGTYRVLNSYSDSFIGEVLVSNTTGAERSWTVTLSYPGELVTSWLESLPQPTLVQRGTTYTWTSSVPLAARSSGSLRFHFRLSGSAGPSGCTVNGSACG